MPLLVNLRHLEAHSITLKGELPVAELDLDLRDDLVRADHPLEYELEAELLGDELLLHGWLRLPLQCLCVRCLKPVDSRVELKSWTQALPLKGDDKVTLVNDCVDLTSSIREDILLEFPQHPLCKADCEGLPSKLARPVEQPSDVKETKPSAWAALDKLKLNN